MAYPESGCLKHTERKKGKNMELCSNSLLIHTTRSRINRGLFPCNLHPIGVFRDDLVSSSKSVIPIKCIKR